MIPKEAQRCMRVPAIVYADDFLISKMKEDITLRQAMNVACLQGIQKYSIVMPDGHQGYGFPIGGVAAMAIDEDGVISPGGVGYDINCLPPGTKVLTPLGYRVSIEDLSRGGRVVSLNSKGRAKSRVRLFLWRKDKFLYEIETASGYKLRLSHDHPVLVRGRGMVEASKIDVGDELALHPFEGVDYEEPPDITIVPEDAVKDVGVRKELAKRGLLPLKARSEKLAILLKILGYALGDGTIADRGKSLILYGSLEDLEEIAADLGELGYKGRIYSRRKTHRVKGYKFERTEYYLKVSAKSLVELLALLGLPRGKKTDVEFTVPDYVFKLPLWMKRLFLAAYFGAELSAPSTLNGYNFYMPELKIVKKAGLASNGIRFLEGVKRLLSEFGVTSTVRVAERSLDRVTLRLLIHSNPENLVKLYSRIGFEYNKERLRKALAAVVYLRLKSRVVEARREARAEIAVAGSKWQALAIAANYAGLVNERFVERSLYESVEEARIPRGFITFERFLEERSEGLVVYDDVVSIRRIPYDGLVYDITVDREEHNFVADGFVVSNCGVRVVRTDLTVDEVRPRIKELVDTLYRNVPSGLGSTGKVRLSVQELERVLDEGVEWAVGRGYGWAEDREHIEERGSWALADSSKVSMSAKRRGAEQLGTLGSGNHFLEVQVVDKVFDERIAKAYGLFEGQVVVMIHTGSRGLGHQVASDYLMVMERAMRKYGTIPPDRELASIPYSSNEAQNYVRAMASAANFAWTNRQMITHWTRESFRQVFHKDPDKLGMRVVYDVAHNIAKIEEYEVEGKRKKLVIHRKGATRAFPPGHPEIPADYRDVGQPVLIPGSMGTGSFILAGVPEGVKSWYTAPHGAGRWMSRARAKRTKSYRQVVQELAAKGIYIRASNVATVVEEMPEAYKDVDKVAHVAHEVGIGRLVARMRPIGVTKG
ncbi:MAG: intein-containing RctB family protein [Desulfurococcales archaeon]|nr:intein-containing RctB family protein [Desulfurococcales archaeon]